MRSRLKRSGISNKNRLTNTLLQCGFTVADWKTDIEAASPVKYRQTEASKHVFFPSVASRVSPREVIISQDAAE